jgi:hypothetical protein
MNGAAIHTCTSVEEDLAVESPYSQCQSASSFSSEPAGIVARLHQVWLTKALSSVKIQFLHCHASLAVW